MLFIDRVDAGRRLSKPLEQLALENPIVLGLPRGGVPVAYEVARCLRAPLDVLVVRKLATPNEPELAIGAIAPGGVVVVNEDIPRESFQSATLAQETQLERAELRRRESLYRKGRPALDLKDQSVILVDDGAATGSSMLAAVRAARNLGAREIIVALPVAAIDACEKLHDAADRVVCMHSPATFAAVGSWYRDFDQTTDRQVCALLKASAREAHARPASDFEEGIPAR